MTLKWQSGGGSVTGGGQRRARRTLLGLLVLLLALTGAGLAFWWVDPSVPGPAGSGTGALPAPVVLDVDLPAAAPAPSIAPPLTRAATGVAAPARVAGALRPGLAADALGPHVAVRVADLSDGAVVFRSGSAPIVPASTLKLLTATAALEVLGPDHVFTTRVVQGPGRQIVLVGGGDPSLLSRPPSARDRADTYPPRADLRSLAAQTARALEGSTSVRLRFDTSLFSGPVAARSWEPGYLPDGVVAPISALWVDEGRTRSGVGRVANPPLRAARVFARALTAEGLRVVGVPRPGAAPREATPVASVDSAPLELIVQRLLEVSDNEAAEVLLRHIGLEQSGRGSFAAGIAGTVDALRHLGVPLAGARLHDGSGLSRANRLDPRTLVAVLRLAADPAHPELRSVLTGLPVAGSTGSLSERFTASAVAGRGVVRAKTGTLTGVSALAGLATDRNGATLVFVLAADRVRLEDTLAARAALDGLAAALGGCRCAA
jgi:D-alanyl-D-alanine carboxypeptidase/D-alanyl-D-alanine-endopeptidase (penicillin-binding protein 4)